MQIYDPKDVQVIIDGTVITGFSDGTFIKAAKDQDAFNTHVGAQGEVTRTTSAHPTGTITVTLKASSPSNIVLGRLAKRKATFPVRIVDRNAPGGTTGGTEAWIKKTADQAWSGNDVENREWAIQVADYDQVI